MIYGYARVSSKTQSYDTQVAALKAAGAEEIIAEKVSGKDTDGRAELLKLLAEVKPGDVVMVCKLDRFARSLKDLIDLIEGLRVREIGFKSLGDPVDTTTPTGRLVLNLIGAIAEFEREITRERCARGIAAKRARGDKLGPKHKLTPHQRNWVTHQLAAGCSQREIARRLNVDQATISRCAAKGSLAGLVKDGVQFDIEFDTQ
jgi:DNA invertase Pin-like site-specific DNA recombinase